MAVTKFPTEVVTLPSKGVLYPKDSLLAKGEIEMKYMTAKEEDILTNQTYIEKGIVIDKLIQSLIVSDINYDDILIGDKNGIMLAARILSYGKEYSFSYNGEEHTVDLTDYKEKELHPEVEKGVNNFHYTLPHTKIPITFKLLTHKDERNIEQELRSLKRIKSNENFLLTTRLKHMITSVGDSDDPKTIREFVDKELLAMDARSLRKYIKEITPDMDLFFFTETSDKAISLPITLQFFYPDVE
mgnify:CR=1 FL=1|tara:strand:+ start:11284 stop:12012 length:729 start_codon:yes stop_codon:yes gene_type:complete